ncbi:hypothetical protein BDV19DRAFT_47964 [Aspergillus venezuelensis]
MSRVYFHKSDSHAVPPESGSLRERLQRLVSIVSHKEGEQLEIHTLCNSKSNFLGWSVGADVPQRVAWQGNDSRPVLMIRTHDAAEISRCSANGVRSVMAWGKRHPRIRCQFAFSARFPNNCRSGLAGSSRGTDTGNHLSCVESGTRRRRLVISV